VAIQYVDHFETVISDSGVSNTNNDPVQHRWCL